MMREGLKFVSSIDSRLDINNLRNKEYAILKSGNGQNFWQFALQGTPGAATQLNWNATVPDEITYVNRRCYVNLKGTITFTGQSAGAGQTLLQARGYRTAPGVSAGLQSYDTLRCLPLSQLFQTFQVTLNGNSISQNIGLWSRILQRFQRSRDDQNLDLSMSPAMPDASFEYADLSGYNMDPQGIYGDNIYDPRGAFTGVTITRNDSTGNVGDMAIVEFDITEPFWLSPFAWSRDDEPVCLQQIRTFNVSANLGGRGNGVLGGSAGSLWSHNNTSAGHGTFTNASVFINEGNILLNYISPAAGQELPKQLYYSWVLPTLYQQTVPGVAAGAVTRVNSQTIQLDSIPPRMYIWIEKSDYLQDMTKTDTFGFRIDKIAVKLDTQSSILNDCTSQDLYQMAVRNGCNITWNQWNGTRGTGIGSIICTNFGLDIPLPYGQAPGQEGKHTLQVTVSATNITGATIPSCTVNVLICEEGVMYISKGLIQFSASVVSAADVLSVQDQVPISHIPSKNVLGGSFWDDVKKFIGVSARPVFNAVKSFLPGIAGQVGEAVLQAHGKGYGKMKGGAMLSSKEMALLK